MLRIVLLMAALCLGGGCGEAKKGTDKKADAAASKGQEENKELKGQLPKKPPAESVAPAMPRCEEDAECKSRGYHCDEGRCRLHPCVEENDRNGDGKPEERYTYKFDADGRNIELELDTGLDGRVNFRIAYEYDARGRRSKSKIDTQATGIVNEIVHYNYDDAGVKQSEESRSPADGKLRKSWKYAYDGSGNLLGQETVDGKRGEVLGRLSYTYDEKGNRLSSRDVHGSVDERWRYAYYDDGDRLSGEKLGKGGKVETRITFRYGGNGNLLAEEADTRGDGEVDKRVSYTYDLKGSVVKTETSYLSGRQSKAVSTKKYSCWQ